MFSQMKDGLTFIGLPASNLTAEEYGLLSAIPGAIQDGFIKVNYLISPYWSNWANDTNTYYDGELINQDIEDQLEILEATRKALKEQEVPAIDVTVNAADLHKIDAGEPRPGIGDSVLLIDPDMELNHMTARIIELTEYPYAPDKHSDVRMANFMARDDADFIADLNKAKEIINNITSGAKIRTTVFEAFAKQANDDITNSKTELIYPPEGGILAQDKSTPSKQVRLTAGGLGISKDSWNTVKTAVTGDGILAEVIVGLLGQFVQLRANQIVVGDYGETISDALIGSSSTWNNKTTLLTGTGIYTGQVTTNQLIAGTAKIGSALIDTIKASQIDVATGKITAAQIETLTVGSNLQMGPNAYIAWGNVTNIPGNVYNPSYLQSTYISQTLISSPSIQGGNIAIGSGNNIFKADENGIYLGNASFSSAPFRVDMMGNVFAQNGVSMEQSKPLHLELGLKCLRISQI